MDVSIDRKVLPPVEIKDADDAWCKDGIYTIKRGGQRWRYPVTDIVEIRETGRLTEANQ